MSTAFSQALLLSRAPLIAEIKPFSPEVGDLLCGRDVAEVAKAYARAGVAAVSVTTGRWHKGRPDMVQAAAESGLPVLQKDFITSRRDLDRSVDVGASAVLLTCRLLRPADLLALAEQALLRGLTPFIEAADADELSALASVPPSAVVAVNNRDIRTRETDNGGVEVSLELHSAARAVTDGPVVSASGLRSPADARRALAGGYDALLIGTALLLDRRGVGLATTAYVEALSERMVA